MATERGGDRACGEERQGSAQTLQGQRTNFSVGTAGSLCIFIQLALDLQNNGTTFTVTVCYVQMAL